MSKNPKTSSSGNKSHTTPKKGSKVEINSLKKRFWKQSDKTTRKEVMM